MTTEAQRRASKKWYRKNRERQIQKSMEYQKKIGKEAVYKLHSEWYANLPEERKEIYRQKRNEWYANLPEEKKREYREKQRSKYYVNKKELI